MASRRFSMAGSVYGNGLYSISNISKIFNLKITKTALIASEEKKTIPTAKRLERGKSNYRAWTTQQLPEIGEVHGFLKKPETTKVMSFFSLKGGTGKTSTAFQVARAHALHNIRTLVIGLDAQESMSGTLIKSANSDSTYDKGLYHILNKEVSLTSCIVQTDLPTLDFIPETIELSILDHWLKNQMRKEYILKEKIIDQIKKMNKYDLIIFDCNPAWSNTVTGALGASDVLISPLGADINSLKAANIFVELLNEFQEDMKHEFEEFLILPTMVEHNKLSQTILAKYTVLFGDLCTLGSIKRSVTVSEANVHGKSLMEMAFNSNIYPDFIEILQEINQCLLIPEEELEVSLTNSTNSSVNAN